MKWMVCVAVLGIAGAAAVFSDDATTTRLDDASARLEFRRHGFTIEALEGAGGDTPFTALAMCLPPTDGFAPNVNVMVQPYPDTIDAYADLSRGQFKQLDLRVVKEEKLADNAVAFEYVGKLGDRDLHWYAVARKRGNQVHLVTATAGKDQWEKVGPRLRKCVDSFRLTPPPEPARPR